MSATQDLIRYAKRFEQPLCVEYNGLKNQYKVYINMVGYKDNYMNKQIFGLGFTIEDACYDFIRLARGGKLIHYITDLKIEVI